MYAASPHQQQMMPVHHIQPNVLFPQPPELVRNTFWTVIYAILGVGNTLGGVSLVMRRNWVANGSLPHIIIGLGLIYACTRKATNAWNRITSTWLILAPCWEALFNNNFWASTSYLVFLPLAIWLWEPIEGTKYEKFRPLRHKREALPVYGYPHPQAMHPMSMHHAPGHPVAAMTPIPQHMPVQMPQPSYQMPTHYSSSPLGYASQPYKQ